jgi:hypothetical protein
MAHLLIKYVKLFLPQPYAIYFNTKPRQKFDLTLEKTSMCSYISFLQKEKVKIAETVSVFCIEK